MVGICIINPELKACPGDPSPSALLQKDQAYFGGPSEVLSGPYFGRWVTVANFLPSGLEAWKPGCE